MMNKKKIPRRFQDRDWMLPKDAAILVDERGRVGFIGPRWFTGKDSRCFVTLSIHTTSLSELETKKLKLSPASSEQKKAFKSLWQKGREAYEEGIREMLLRQEERQKRLVEQSKEILSLIGLSSDDFDQMRLARFSPDGKKIHVETEEGYEGFSPEAVKKAHQHFINRGCHDGEAVYTFQNPKSSQAKIYLRGTGHE